MLVHIGLMSALVTSWRVVEGAVAVLLNAFLVGMVTHQAYLMVHEAGHHALFPSRRWNLWVGWYASVFAILPFHTRQQEHARHHVLVGSFHEPATARALQRLSSLPAWTAPVMDVLWRAWVPMFAVNEHLMLWRLSLVRSRGIPGGLRERRASAVFSVVGVLLLVGMAGPWTVVRLCAVGLGIPLYFVIIEFMNLPHHLDSPIEAREGATPLWQQDTPTRSCRRMPWVGGWLLLNFNHHVAHHLFPWAPWSALPSLDAMLPWDANADHSEWEWHVAVRGTPFHQAFRKYLDRHASTELHAHEDGGRPVHAAKVARAGP